MASRTAPTYLIEAAAYNDEKLEAAALKLCVETCGVFRMGDLGYLDALPPPLLVRVVDALPAQPVEGGQSLSRHVAAYCRAHPDEVDVALLRVLTHADKMPAVAPSEALFLLELALKHLFSDDGGDGGGCAAAAAAAANTTDGAVAAATTASTFFDRCLAAFAA